MKKKLFDELLASVRQGATILRGTRRAARTAVVTELGRERLFDAVIERDSDGYFVAWVPALPGCHTQARSRDELAKRIREAIKLCLEVGGEPFKRR